jgi:SAM-dependent methyltransferase
MPVSTVVLLHSPLVGPSTWYGVAAELEKAGYSTVVPDLRGATQNAAIIDAVADQVPASTTVLVGHSAAALLLPAIAERLGTTSAIVNVDGRLPRPGQSWVDTAPAELVEQLKSTMDADGRIAAWPDWWPPESFVEHIPDADQRAAFLAEAPRLPWAFFTEPGPVAEWRGPQSYLLLSEPYEDVAHQMLAAGHPVVELHTDHLAPLTRPVEVAAALRELLDAPPSGLRFGTDAQAYDDVRLEYPDEIVSAGLAYAGHPSAAVEVGAGTGKASQAFAVPEMDLTCLEPDPAMATVLRRRFADRPHVTVVESTFEQWTPPTGGVPLLYFALSWHWADPASRTRRAHDALAPGGALALLDHQHTVADPHLENAIHAVYDETAPQLRPGSMSISGSVVAERSAELADSGYFTGIETATVSYDHPYPTQRYLRLLGTFSSHLAVAPARRRRLHARIGEAIDAAGGVVVVRLVTTLVLARRRR